MYKIYADDTLIYDSTIDDYKIGKGSVSLETNKSGSFTFSVYPDHFFYDSFVKLKTIITVYKSGKIIFRGRILNDVTDYWNNKVITCEGELGFLQDSIIRPFTFNGTPEDLFIKFVEEHNSQVDVFKRFKIGTVTVLDPNNYIARSNSAYESALSNLNSRLIEDSLGGYIHITHGEDGADPTPTIKYLADFTRISSQTIEFGSNLKNYTKTVKSEEVATAIIPLGAEVDDGKEDTENPKLTIASVNNGVDYVYDEAAVAEYGWIFKVVEWEDVTEAVNLKRKAEAYLADVVKQNITIELNAIDLHLLDHSIESFKVGDYVRVVSAPHNFADTLLCQKQTIDLLKPENDTITLGHTYTSFTATTAKSSAMASTVSKVEKTVDHLNKKTNRYKIAEQQLAALMSRSFGVFNTEEVLEDGSTIFYMHDEPNLANSKNVWKMTENVFAVSTDGGKTWNAGIDASGNAILNILSVIGINASWINADNLTAISANIGGWEIRDNAIYKWHEDKTTGYRYKVYIRPPDRKFYATNDEPFLEIQESCDRGVTYHRIVALNDVGLDLWNYDGNEPWQLCQYTSLGVTIFDYKTKDTIDLSENKISVRNGLGLTSYMTPTGLAVSSLTGKTTSITIGNVKMTFAGGILVNAANV